MGKTPFHASKEISPRFSGKASQGSKPFRSSPIHPFMLQGRLGFFHARTYFSCFKVSPSSPHHLSRTSKEDAGSIVGGQATCLASPFYRTVCLFQATKRVVVLWRTSPLKHDNTLFMPVSGRLSTCLQVPNTMAD